MMSSHQPSIASAAPSVRVPKLAVRNRTGTQSSNGSSNASQANSSQSSTRTASPRRDRGTSDLRVLDAQTLDDIAAVHLPGRVPAGFHGNWAPAEG